MWRFNTAAGAEKKSVTAIVQPMVKVVATAGQSIPNATRTMLTSWNTAVWQTMAGMWTAGAPSRLVAPVAGYYEVTVSLQMTGLVIAEIFKNAAGSPAGASLCVGAIPGESAGGGAGRAVGSSVMFLAAGDYLELGVYQTSGSTQVGTGNTATDYGTGFGHNYFALVKVDGAVVDYDSAPTVVAPSARVRKSGTQTVASSTFVPVVFDLEDFDTNGIHDPALNTRLTCQTAGKYLVIGRVEWSADPDNAEVRLRKNGAEYLDMDNVISGDNRTGLATSILDLAVTDYVELVVRHFTGSDRVLATACHAEIAKIDGAVLSYVRVPVVAGYGTVLPAGPVDGQEYVLVDSLTAPTYQWRFRYNAGSASAYKWEFVGGAAKWGTVDTSESTASTTAVDLATVGPAFTVPREGDYLCSWGSDASCDLSGHAMAAVLCKAGVEQAVAAIVSQTAGSAYQWRVWREYRLDGVAAAAVLSVRYKASGGTGYFRRRDLSILPVRVA